jgi:NHL repeat
VRKTIVRSGVLVLSSGSLMLGGLPPAHAAPGSFLGSLPRITTVASTVPANGDINPYGVAVAPRTVGKLHRGSVLVSNFNAKSNAQGTGTTIVEISPAGTRKVFATVTAAHLPGPCPGGVGLSTALVALRSGWVIVGSLPTKDGSAATAKAGCLLVLDSSGQVRETFSGHGINGPWDATASDSGKTAELYVSNVLNGTRAAAGKVVHRGTVLRLRLNLKGSLPRLVATRTVASGLAERTDPDALVVGPTGLALAKDGTLYVADTVNSRLAAIPHAPNRTTSAGQGATVRMGGALKSPLGLVIAPNGHLLTVNGGNGNILEVSPEGQLVAKRSLNGSGSPPGAGALFGLAIAPHGHGIYFVDDATNRLRLLH